MEGGKERWEEGEVERETNSGGYIRVYVSPYGYYTGTGTFPVSTERFSSSW